MIELLDDIYYYSQEHKCWKPSFVISIIKDKNKYVVAEFGPSLPFAWVLSEDDYIMLVDNKTIADYTLNLIKQ